MAEVTLRLALWLALMICPIDQAPSEQKPSAHDAVLVRKAELEAELAGLKFSDAFDAESHRSILKRIAFIQYESNAIQGEIRRMDALPQSVIAALPKSIGPKIVRQAQLEAEIWDLKKRSPQSLSIEGKEAELRSLTKEIDESYKY